MNYTDFMEKMLFDREYGCKNHEKGLFPKDKKRRMKGNIIHLIIGIEEQGMSCSADLRTILYDWCQDEEQGERNIRYDNVLFLDIHNSLDRETSSVFLHKIHEVLKRRMEMPGICIHYISRLHDEEDAGRLFEVNNVICTELQAAFGIERWKEYAYLFLPDNKKEKSLTYFHEENVRRNIFHGVHLAGGENIHTSRNVRFSLCCQLTAEYIFHCLESHDACPEAGIVLPGVKKYYTLNGKPAGYHYREISNVVIHEFLKKFHDGGQDIPGPDEGTELLLRSIDLGHVAPEYRDRAFYDYFWHQITSVEPETMVSREERKEMIHGREVEQFMDYCKRHVMKNKHKLDYELERRVRREEIRERWTRNMLSRLKDEVVFAGKGLSYVKELCDGDQSPVKDYLTAQMEKANRTYHKLGEEKESLKKEYEQILNHCEHNLFFMLMQGKRLLVELMEKACEVELLIYRFQWLEKLLRECILVLIHDISPQVRGWSEPLLYKENFYQKKVKEYPVPFDDKMKAMVRAMLDGEPVQELKGELTRILINGEKVHWENFLERELLTSCPYEELEKTLNDGKEKGYFIPPAVRNREIRTHVHTDMESVLKEHYPYCNI